MTTRRGLVEPRKATTTLTIRMPVILKEQIEVAAKAQDRSVGNYVVRVLKMSLGSVSSENPCTSDTSACSGECDHE